MTRAYTQIGIYRSEVALLLSMLLAVMLFAPQPLVSGLSSCKNDEQEITEQEVFVHSVFVMPGKASFEGVPSTIECVPGSLLRNADRPGTQLRWPNLESPALSVHLVYTQTTSSDL